MNLAALIATYRTYANDKVQPYFASDEEVTGWLNEAVAEAAIRGRLIHEDSDPAVCLIAVTPGTASYKLSPLLYELTYCAFLPDGAARAESLRLVSVEKLEILLRDWRSIEGRPQYAVQGDTSLRLIPRPAEAGSVVMEGYRTPKAQMLLADKDTDTPEIAEYHHRHLIQWALYRGFSIPDTEAFDPQRASIAEAEFTRHFGIRPDSDLRRKTREDYPHIVAPDWP